MLQYDKRVGCIAVYRGAHRTCLAGISMDPLCVYYGEGNRKNGSWTVPRYKIRIAKRIYRLLSKE